MCNRVVVDAKVTPSARSPTNVLLPPFNLSPFTLATLLTGAHAHSFQVVVDAKVTPLRTHGAFWSKRSPTDLPLPCVCHASFLLHSCLNMCNQVVVDAKVTPYAHARCVNCLCVGADAGGGMLLYSGGEEGAVRVWKAQGGGFQLVRVYTCFSSADCPINQHY